MKIRERQYEDDKSFIHPYKFIWRPKVPLKMLLHRWVLLRRRIMRNTFNKWLYLGTVAECILCSGGKEDSAHPFFERPFARMFWTSQTIPGMDATSRRHSGIPFGGVGIEGRRKEVAYSRCYRPNRYTGTRDYSRGGRHLQMGVINDIEALMAF